MKNAKYNPVTLVTGLLVLIIFLAMLFCFQVRQTEVVVVTTFGRFTRAITEPGLKLRWPWPIQNLYRFDHRIHNFEKHYEQTTTRDSKTILVDVFLAWRIKDPKVFLERFSGDMARAEEGLEVLLRAAKNGVIGQHPLSDLISPNPQEVKFSQMEEEMLNSIKQPALESYGIEVVALGIKQLGLPQGVTEKVFERMKAEKELLVKQYQGEAAGEAIRIRSEADLERERILAEAEKQARIIRGQAEAEAAKYFKTFEQDPEFAVFLLKLNALEQALKDRATLILDTRTTPFDVLNSQREGRDAKSTGK
ncbi:MAG: protease modulator HflC [Verrucomicrobiae bacterium]|nr:protease modulator HflC [Verrucomicrobiae bacterium]